MMRKTLSNTLAALGLAIALTAGFGQVLIFGHSLRVDVRGVRSADGVVHVLVYDRAAAFEASSAMDIAAYRTLAAAEGEMSFAFHRLTPGRYAISVHHDENANNGFDTIDGAPLEGYAYSRNVGRRDLPTFDQAAFVLGKEVAISPIAMIYPD